MTMTFDDSHYDALILWAFDPPPLGRPHPSVAGARINSPSQLPKVILDGTPQPVIGTTPSGWLSVVDFGWCRFTGDPDAVPLIGAACNPIQSQMLSDRAAFDAALHRYMARCDESRIGGLPVITLEGGQRAVRLADITVPQVLTGIEAALDRLGPDHRIDPEDEPSSPLPPGLIEADLWWRFCRNWSG